mmetsp:Transcript_5378/g.13725  ORF Transcript_5378/g.13725 Transcript_5378/m.13725 type:complete len:567 (-) Transcript_5378:112-1812(-)
MDGSPGPGGPGGGTNGPKGGTGPSPSINQAQAGEQGQVQQPQQAGGIRGPGGAMQQQQQQGGMAGMPGQRQAGRGMPPGAGMGRGMPSSPMGPGGMPGGPGGPGVPGGPGGPGGGLPSGMMRNAGPGRGMGAGGPGGPGGPMGMGGMAPGPSGGPSRGPGGDSELFATGFKMTPTTRLLQYTNTQRRRPQDNNIGFWRTFVKEFFAPGSLMRWCVSSNSGKDNASGSRTMVSTVDALPRLFQVKYESGLKEEFLFLGQPQELYLPNGHTIVLFESLMEEAVFEELRVIRVGKLRILFNNVMQMRLWEFSIEGHCNLVPHRLILNKLQHLKDMNAEIQKRAMAVLNQRNQTPQQHEEILQGSIQEMLMLTNQMASSMEQVCVNDHGYSKRFMRSLQVADVINILEDLFHMSQQNPEIGPMEHLQIFAKEVSKPNGMPPGMRRSMPSSTDMFDQEMMSNNMSAPVEMMGGNQMDVQANMRKQQQWSPAMQQQMKPDGGMQQISPNMQPMQPGMGWQMQGGSRGLRVSQGSGMMASEAPGMMSMQGQRQGGQMGMQGESPNLQMNNEGE